MAERAYTVLLATAVLAGLLAVVLFWQAAEADRQQRVDELTAVMTGQRMPDGGGGTQRGWAAGMVIVTLASGAGAFIVKGSMDD